MRQRTMAAAEAEGYASLTQLAAALRQSAGQTATISLDESFLTQAVLQILVNALQLPSGTTEVVLENADPTKITFSSDNQTLFIVGAQFSETVLNLDAAPAMVAIQQTSESNFGYNLIVNVGLAPGWTFGTSFPPLAGLQPPDYIVAEGPCLYVSSFGNAQAIPAFPVSGRCTSNAGASPLLQGLNYYAGIGPTGIFAQIANLITGAGVGPFPIYGTIQPATPEFDVQAPLGTLPSVTIGYITASAATPWLGISAGETAGQLSYYLGTKIDVQSAASAPVSFEIDVTLPTTATQTFTISLASGNSTPLSLGNLASALFNTTQDALTSNVPPMLQGVLTAVGSIQLQTLTGTFSLPTGSSSATIQTVTGGITTSTWTPPLPGLPTLDLTLGWTMDFTQTPFAWTILFTADMTFSANLAFEVVVKGDSQGNVTITGTEKGSITIGLSDLNALLPTGITIPDDIANLTFTNFQIDADIAKKNYTISGELAFSLNLFGLQLLSIPDMNVKLVMDSSGQSTQATFTFDGSIFLGSLQLAASGTVSNVEGTDTVFTMHLVSQTVGSMLNGLAQLVDPGASISFSSPWDAFLNISLDALVLTIDVTKGTVSLTYTTNLNLVFITIDSISLTYTKAQGATASAVSISLEAQFIGEDSPSTKTWDALNENPPAAPSPKPPIFDLVYAGLGQHIQLAKTPTTMADVIKDLIESVVPVQSGQLPAFGTDSIVFSEESNWLIGAQFSVMGTVSISAIFNDPSLYGVLIALSGDKAGSFAGLSFEILYRKVTDSIGVYHIELKLPDAMRNLQFGEVSITLPIVVLDIYTNGNFRVDFGFPNGLDFSNSFCVQVFPFVGYGGFYFALLDGSTASNVPVITNGTFSPVIEFGVALSIGVGKTVNEGVLSGGISVTVVGILQGVLAWFNPSDNSNKEMYYWFQGTIAITGKLYATIDFGIISASLDVTAYASVTLTIQAHEPIYIAISAGVSVEVAVKIVFFTIHFSFSATINASFTIGSQTPTPWIVAAGGGSTTALAPSDHALRAARRAVMLARPGMARALRAAVAAAAAPASLTNWPPVPVAAPQTLTLYALPTFNKIPPSAGAAAADPAVNAVFLLAAPNSIPPSAQNRADRLMLAGDASSAPFNLLMEAMLSWAIYAITNPQPTQPPYTMPATVTADNLNQLQTLLKDPTTLGAAFDYTTLTNFLAANFTFNVSTIDSVNSETGVAVFPVFPAITLSDTANLSNGVNFSTPTVDDTYVTQVKAYFELLQVQFEQRNQSQQGATAAPAGTPTTSVAQLVYSQYFSMLMSAGVKSAIDLLASFPYTTPTGASINISTIAGNVGDTTLEGEPMRIVSPNQNLQVLQQGTGLTLSGVTHQIRAGETLANIGLAYQSLGGLDPSGNPYIPATLLGQNLGTAGIFNPSVAVPLANIAYTTQQYDSLNMICSMFLVRAGSPGSVNSLTGLTSMVQTLLGLNSSITSPTEVLAAGTTLTLPQSANYTTNQGDTITLVAAYLLETVQGATAVAAMVAALQKLNGGNVPVNPPADTALNIPPVSRTLSAADSVDSLAGLVLTTTNNVVGNLTALPAVIFTGATPPSGSNRYTTNAGDTLNILGARLLIQGGGQAAVNALTGLAAQVTAIEGLNPSIANPNAAISPGATIALPQSQTYTSVAGDTLTLIAAYTLDIAQDTADMALCLAALLPLNPTLKVTDPTQPQPAGTVLVMPVTASLLAAQGTLNVPLSYAIQQGDTFSGIATKFNQTLQDVATAATTLQNGAMPAVFAPGQNLTISDLASIGVPTLLADLLNQAEFNNASGMVSRFLLSGLRLPDPTDDLASLTAGHLQKLTSLGSVGTSAMYALTGQQYTVPYPVPADYQMILANNTSPEVAWLQFNGQAGPLSFALTQNQLDSIQAIATDTTFNPVPATMNRLALFQMTPPRVAIQNYIAWQAAVLPPELSTGAPGNPAIWLFPDSLVTQIENLAAVPSQTDMLYQVVVARHAAPDTPVNTTPAQQYCWGTIVDFTISLPPTEGPTPSVANTYLIGGADDTGAGILESLLQHLGQGTDTASLYLLYSTGGSGLVSDPVNLGASYILKTNLSTLTNPGTQMRLAARPTALPPGTFAAAMSDPTDFIALLWEAGITRSGGYYLNYFNGSAPLPGSVFTGASQATLSLVVLLNSQLSPDAPILPFNNCAVVSDHIDTTVSNVFVQPAIYVVQSQPSGSNTLANLASGLNQAFGADFTVAEAAQFNATAPQFLLAGASITIPWNSNQQHTIQPADTLASIAGTAANIPILANANATAPILGPLNTLANVASGFNEAYGTGFTAAQVAQFNATVPQFLLTGASITIPWNNNQAQTIQYGDTLASIAGSAANIPVLANANAAAAILAPGSPAQFALGVLSPATTVPPGTAGFELTLPNGSADPVGSMFNMMGYSIAPVNGFTASGEGLPTTPSTAPIPNASGLSGNPPAGSTTDPFWYYTQAMAVAPFGSPQNGSLSAALPSAAMNPYNGITTTPGVGNSVQIDVALQDIFGNQWQFPTGQQYVNVPFGYYDPIVSLGSWPSLAISYTVSAASGETVAITFDISMQQARYIPAPGVAAKSSRDAVKADLQTYTTIYYQLAQDFTFTLQTSLDVTKPSYSLSSLPFNAFARGAYIYLATLRTMKHYVYQVPQDNNVPVSTVLANYGVTGAQLFTANQNKMASDLFGAPQQSPLVVPAFYTTAATDTLESIIAQGPVTLSQFLTWNAAVPLAAGADLTVVRPNVAAANTDSLASVAARNKCSAAGLVNANLTPTNLLQEGQTFTAGTSSYTTGNNDSFGNIAKQLGVNPVALANACQFLTGIFVNNASLVSNDVVASATDSLLTLAGYLQTTVAAVAANNTTVPAIFPTATPVQTGVVSNPAWVSGQSLADFAQTNHVTIGQLGAANTAAQLVSGPNARLDIPGTLNPPDASSYCTYTAGADTLGGIATKFNQSPITIATLNQDIPGLLIANQTINDSSVGKSVQTGVNDTFNGIIAKFAAQGVTLQLSGVAGLVATQTGLIQPGGLWISTVMPGNAAGSTDISLAGLASAYNTDPVTLGTANAACPGFLNEGVQLSLWGVPYVTSAFETLNSLANRVNATGFTLTVNNVQVVVAVSDIVGQVGTVTGLINAEALVAPVPPPDAPAAPSPLANYVTVTPHFGAPIFNLAVNIISSRTAAWVDPDFTNSPGVQSSTYAVAPNPNPQAQDAPFSLTDFASQLQSAIPDVYVATGDAVTEFDPASAGTLWLVNFGNAAGPDITWQFNWSLPTYFALPPLCTALLGGPVDVTPYQSGQPMKGPDVSQNFQAVDLDDWMRTFLGAVDLFLSPAYASGAYPIDPDDVNKVIAGKEAIAEAMSAGLEIVLTSQQGQGNIADAIAAMKQAMLAQLSQAYSIDTLVQAPVTVTSPVSDPSSAPRLSGKLLVTPGSQNLGSTPDSYSFSTAKVSLVNPNPPAVPAPAATFLFSVKNPAANKDVSLSVQFEATDIEIPDPQAAFDGYEGSYWLKLVSPGTSVQSAAGSIDIPVPLRSYPSPVLLASQTAIQTVADPQAPTDLIGWNLQFIYNHDDAEQDMPLAVITFNPADTNNGAPPAPVNPLTQRIFQALARFIAVFPQLQQDLTLLKQAPPASNDVAKYAVQAFAKLAEGVADAFQMDMALAVESGLTEIVYAYTFEKNSSGGTLQTLTVTTVDPETGAPITLTSPIWPAIVAFPNGVAQQLQAQQVPPNQMQYTYQGSIPADLAFEQQLYFNVAAPSNPAPMAPPGMPNAQVFSFGNQNVFLEQSGRAGISVTRNLNLVGTPTNPDFVYQTPLTSFSNVAVPFIYATGDISIGSGNPATPGLVAQALGAFLQKLLTSQNTWQDGDTIDIRIAASYSYSLAAGTTQDTPQLGALVPITFVPDYSFNPNTDWQPASGSFVTQLDQIVGNWYSTNQPVVSNGYYVFDLTVYAAAGDFQPLIRATSLRYQLLSS